MFPYHFVAGDKECASRITVTVKGAEMLGQASALEPRLLGLFLLLLLIFLIFVVAFCAITVLVVFLVVVIIVVILGVVFRARHIVCLSIEAFRFALANLTCTFRGRALINILVFRTRRLVLRRTSALNFTLGR
jgi:hypothetical protein